MILSQALMDQVAELTLGALGHLVEEVTIAHRETPSAAPVVYGPFAVTLQRYSDHMIAQAALVASDRPMVLRDDRRVLLPTAEVTWTPTIYNEVIRASGDAWRVLNVGGGEGYPFYVLQIRKPSATS